MSPDWAAEGLLEGLESGDARAARVRLLDELHASGVGLDELRRAVAEHRLALLPVERILAGDGQRLTAREVSERTGTPEEVLERMRRALGLPIADRDDPVYSEDDLHAAELQKQISEIGFGEEDRLAVARVIGRSMSQIGEAVRDLTARTFRRPGDTELDVALRYAEAARAALPLLGPLVQSVLSMHLREQVRQDVISATDLEQAGVGAMPIAVCFADLVGFTRLGEEVPTEQLSVVAQRVADLATDVATGPVRLVKLIGDAAMLVSREPRPLLDAAFAMLDAAEAQADELPQLHIGMAYGDAVGHAGDWYGRPVNLASRITQVARPGSVLVSPELRDAAGRDAYQWSFAGRRRLKGIGEVPLYRARPREDEANGRRQTASR